MRLEGLLARRDALNRITFMDRSPGPQLNLDIGPKSSVFIRMTLTIEHTSNVTKKKKHLGRPILEAANLWYTKEYNKF